MAEDANCLDIELSDVDRDSLHILPLSILPIQTPGLKRARMIKNQELDGVIEMFSTNDAGSGQIEVKDLPQEFSWPTAHSHPDMKMLMKLRPLPSYDVYSLRISLRNLKIDVERQDALKLSQSMNKKLTTYMSNFTRPLLVQIYGKSEMGIQNFNDVLMLFRDPNPRNALDKLTIMAEKLGIGVADVPDFIEQYGDIFLSLAYYRKCLKDIWPMAEDFLVTLQEIRKNNMHNNYPGLAKAIVAIEDTVNFLSTSIDERLGAFDTASRNMWDNLSAAHFQKVRRMIESHHAYIGGALCALTVKMNGWYRKFPTARHGSFPARCEFLVSDMKQGIGRIREQLKKAAMGAQQPAGPFARQAMNA